MLGDESLKSILGINECWIFSLKRYLRNFFLCVNNLCVVCLFICFVKVVFLMPLTSVGDFV